MTYYRWRAYNQSTQEFSGVIASPRYELVALKIISQGLTPALIEAITYEEYKVFKTAETRINQLRKSRTMFGGLDDIEIPREKRLPISGLALLCGILTLLLIGALSLLSYHYLK